MFQMVLISMNWIMNLKRSRDSQFGNKTTDKRPWGEAYPNSFAVFGFSDFYSKSQMGFQCRSVFWEVLLRSILIRRFEPKSKITIWLKSRGRRPVGGAYPDNSYLLMFSVSFQNSRGLQGLYLGLMSGFKVLRCWVIRVLEFRNWKNVESHFSMSKEGQAPRGQSLSRLSMYLLLFDYISRFLMGLGH